MERPRTLRERVTQLGRIARIEGDLMKMRHQHGVMRRTNKAKKILWQYEVNLFGVRGCDLEFGFGEEQENTPFTIAQFQGKENP